MFVGGGGSDDSDLMAAAATSLARAFTWVPTPRSMYRARRRFSSLILILFGSDRWAA